LIKKLHQALLLGFKEKTHFSNSLGSHCN